MDWVIILIAAAVLLAGAFALAAASAASESVRVRSCGRFERAAIWQAGYSAADLRLLAGMAAVARVELRAGEIRVVLSHVDGSGDGVVITGSRLPPGVLGSRVALGEGLAGRALLAGKPIVRRLRTPTELAVPIRSGGAMVGVVTATVAAGDRPFGAWHVRPAGSAGRRGRPPSRAASGRDGCAPRHGMSWLERLPDLARECRERWELVGDGTFPDTFRYVELRHVEPVRTRDGAAAVLKLAPNVSGELAALEWFSGHGAVRVLAADPARGAMLLERALPGTALRELAAHDEEAATAAAADLMGALWRPAPADHRFETVREWGEDLEGRAAGLYAELCDSMGEPVVLHGDLHHDNVLRSGRDGWLAIDPEGVVGEREYETGALLRNPWPGLLDLPHPGRILRRRADQLAEALDLDLERVRGWAYAQAVLAGVWFEQDGHDPAFMRACADLLEPLTR